MLQRLERSEAVERLEQLQRAPVFDSANHVQVDVNQTAMQVFVGLYGGGVITILPERPLPIFALVVFLRGAPCYELHTFGNNVLGLCP
jgi:hypothetical protein